MQKALVIIAVVVGLGLFSYADGFRHLEGLFNAIGFVVVCGMIVVLCWKFIEHFIINKTNKDSIKTKKNSTKENDFKDYQG